ncbi:MAG TPA: preprotein translocase subunit SecE [Armatimonadota bacterium]|nr:preprotein translocase subunit SecE [Armatimonadota bacterium]
MSTISETQQPSRPPAGGSGFVDSTVQFVKDAYAEMHRVQWPSQKTVTQHTIICVCLIIFMALYIGGLDYIFTLGFDRLFGITPGGAG